MVEWGQKILGEKGLKGYTFGHAGSGNLHMEILGNPEDETQWQKVKEAEEEIVRFALECGGTATGEHGIGIGKEEIHGKGAWRKPQINETDQGTFGSQRNHESRKDV